MKISKINHPLAESSARVVSDDAIKEPSTVLTFQRSMSNLTDARLESHIAVLVSDITEQGKRMSERADMREFHRYREMIRSLMDEIVSNGFAFSKFRKFDARGRNRTFALIEKVNAKLEEIMNELLRNEVDHLMLLSSVDDIRGMLVDMLM